MKVFKFLSGQYFYVCSGQDQELAKAQLFEDLGEMEIDTVEEIPESEWDMRNITLYEDNDIRRKSFKVSIREMLEGDAPQFLFTNDSSID